MSVQPTGLPDPTRVVTLAEAHGRHRAPRVRTDWRQMLVLGRRASVTPVAPVLPVPPAVEAAPLPTRPANDPTRAAAFKAAAAAEHILSLAPMPDDFTVRCGRIWPAARVEFMLHRDRELARFAAYRELLGGAVTQHVHADGAVRHELMSSVYGVEVLVWTLLDAEDGAQ